MKLKNDFGEFELSVDEFKQLTNKNKIFNNNSILSKGKTQQNVVNYFNNNLNTKSHSKEIQKITGLKQGTLSPILSRFTKKGLINKLGKGYYVANNKIDLTNKKTFFSSKKHWSDDEDKELVKYLGEGKSINQIMIILNRSYDSVYCRAKKLRLVGTKYPIQSYYRGVD